MTARLDYNGASPLGMKALGHVYRHVRQSGLDAGLIDLVYLRVSLINGCAYCIDAHTRDLLKRGVAADKLPLLPVWREAAALFSAEEQAAVAWAETVTRVADTGIPDADYETARGVFDAQQLTDLTIAIGLINAYNRLGVGFRAVPAAVQHAAG
ncbi:carboxymuconolactone decarboxylase family protein [Sphingosinicellaceae bacterium]|nr:carboxymuconolactone decarboxylase family protein [Sphingosinicellaceae bacterium]